MAMKIKPGICILLGAVLFCSACSQRETSSGSQPQNQSAVPPAPAAAPAAPAGPVLTDFRGELLVKDVPKEMKSSGTAKLQVTVTNKSSDKWPALLPGRSKIQAVNISYRWWQGKDMVDEGKRALLSSDLGPGESATLELTIEAPTAPGIYTLKVEPVQEAVAWFSDKGGCSFETKVRVVQ